ncbi:uncharacterized protein LOC130894129 [Diorhabda carinulata]|uniref:uncharacterized protein LOC130894129 n=1 Tax=Diorhabda carinulata TaxID=1163345 RepID=UPI00259FED50|nr:uncharacterized protein LOC130894129 [Diorhabda carinulata]
MLCRLCLLGDNNYQKLEGAICDMLRAVLRKKYKQIGDSVICNGCVKKLKDAFDFKTTTVRAQKIVSLYGGSDTKVVYIRDNKLCITSKNDNTIKLCKTCLTLIEHNLCVNLIGTYEIIDILKIYIPEVIIHEREPSLLCYKCLDRFRIFSEIINMVNNTENMITTYCNEKGINNTEQLTLDYLVAAINNAKVSNDANNMKLLDGDHFFDLENELLLTDINSGIMEDSKKRIIKKIIEEDVDLFYKEKPHFDLDEQFSNENEIDNNQRNIFFNIQSPLLTDLDDDTQYKNNVRSVESASLRHSFETEESSLSPGALSDRNFYECEEGQDDLKKEERETTSPNPFIFFNDFAQNSTTCTCKDASTAQKKAKRKLCDKCKWKKVLGFNSEISSTNRDSMDDEDDDLNMKKSKRDGKKKCRKAYGIEFKELWCTQCRWKKACTRFGNTKAVNRR